MARVGLWGAHGNVEKKDSHIFIQPYALASKGPVEGYSFVVSK